MSTSKPRVVYWLKEPTPYFVERGNAVTRRGNVGLELWFNGVREQERSWEVHEADWLFPARYIPQRRFLKWHHRVPIREIATGRPDLLLLELDRSYFVAGFLVGRALAKRVSFRALPHFDEVWSQRKWWREAVRHFLFRSVDSAKVPGASGRRQAVGYGLAPDRVFAVTQSINVARFSAALDIPPDVRAARRAELGLEGCVFIYVGRIRRLKGLDYLFDAYRRLASAAQDVSLLLVGDGVDEGYFRHLARDMPRVVFAGFVQPRELPNFYALADISVFPTLADPNGLVLEEAMAAGLPVITSDAAADARTRLPEGEAGYVVPAADADALATRMLLLAGDPVLRHRLGEHAAKLAERCAPERYAEDFERFIDSTLALPPRRTLPALIARAAGWALTPLARLQE